MAKIVIISDFVFPNYVGGSARFVYDLIRGFSENNTEYLLITRKSKRSYYKVSHNDSFYDEEKRRGRIIEIGSVFDIVKSLKHINKDSILFVHYPILGFIYISLFPKNKIVYFFHGPNSKEYYEKLKKKNIGYYLRLLIEKFVLSKPHMIMVLSDYMKKEAQEILKIPEGRIKKVPPLFDFDKFSALRRKGTTKESLRNKHGVPKDKIVLFTNRRLTNRTGVLELIEAFAKINDKRYFLIIAGKGELQERIKKLSNSSTNISFVGYLSETDLVEYLSLSDIYVLPSKTLEGFGLVVLEAMAAGLPVIVSSNSGGAVEFIKTIDPNLVFDFDDFENSFKAVLDYCSKRYIKPNSENSISKYVENYKREKIAKFYASLIMEELK